MPWTMSQLKAAMAAYPAPQPTTPDAWAAALNTQTTTLTNQPFTLGQARVIARQSLAGDWARIVMRSRQTATLPPATATDAAVLAAINVCAGSDGDVIDPNSSATWAAWQAGMAALEASGDLSSASAAAIAALTTKTVEVWQPALTAGDIQNAEIS